MMDEFFETLNLNDSLVKKVVILSGEVYFYLEYVVDYETQVTKPAILKFVGCSKIISEMNLDVVWPDSILSGTIELDGDEKWYVLAMNTSGSIVKIKAKAVELSV